MEFVNSAHSFPIIEHYDGSAWSLVTSAQPTQVGDLEAVAALTPANVWAVGSGHTPAGVNAPSATPERPLPPGPGPARNRLRQTLRNGAFRRQ